MSIVAIVAVISTVNSNIAGLSHIAAGMAKIGLLPEFFMKRNKKDVPYISVLIIGGAMLVINATGLSTTGKLSFMILSAKSILIITVNGLRKEMVQSCVGGIWKNCAGQRLKRC